MKLLIIVTKMIIWLFFLKVRIKPYFSDCQGDCFSWFSNLLPKLFSQIYCLFVISYNNLKRIQKAINLGKKVLKANQRTLESKYPNTLILIKNFAEADQIYKDCNMHILCFFFAITNKIV